MKSLLSEKILSINSVGDSKRIPQYSACGKLFALVARMIGSDYISTIFDELLIASIDIPNRIGKGVLIFPSDTELLFNSVQLDLLSCEAAGLSMKAPVTEGVEHGVFLQGENKADHRNYNASRFLHKLPENVLRNQGAVDVNNEVDIDTGCIWLGQNVIRSLIELFSVKGKVDIDLFEKFVNPKVCLNFYSDFVYPLSENGTLQEYLEQDPENGFSKELTVIRTMIWQKLNQHQISLVRLVPAQYIHFGMTHEMYDLWTKEINTFDYLGWKKRINTNATSGTVLRSYVAPTVCVPENAYMEDCMIDAGCILGEGVILSNIDIKGNVRISAGVVINGLQQKGGLLGN